MTFFEDEVILSRLQSLCLCQVKSSQFKRHQVDHRRPSGHFSHKSVRISPPQRLPRVFTVIFIFPLTKGHQTTSKFVRTLTVFLALPTAANTKRDRPYNLGALSPRNTIRPLHRPNFMPNCISVHF